MGQPPRDHHRDARDHVGLNGWYGEAVFGIENLFSVLRLDVHRRVTHPSWHAEAWDGVGLGVELTDLTHGPRRHQPCQDLR